MSNARYEDLMYVANLNEEQLDGATNMFLKVANEYGEEMSYQQARQEVDRVINNARKELKKRDEAAESTS